MKYFIVFALIAVASAKSFMKPTVLSQEQQEIQEIIAAIASPSTDPATAAALESMLHDFLGIAKPDQVSFVDSASDALSPISVGPAIVSIPAINDGGALSFPEAASVSPVVNPSPAIVPVVDSAPVEVETGSPLVQIILNINQASSNSPAGATPAIVPVVTPAVDAENTVDEVQFVDVAVDSVNLVEQAVDAVNVVDHVVQPVVVADVPLVQPSPAITLPEILN